MGFVLGMNLPAQNDQCVMNLAHNCGIYGNEKEKNIHKEKKAIFLEESEKEKQNGIYDFRTKKMTAIICYAKYFMRSYFSQQKMTTEKDEPFKIKNKNELPIHQRPYCAC